MNWDATSNLLYQLSNNWVFLGVLVGSIPILLIPKLTRVRAVNMLLPVGLLLLRRVLLYVPVSGTISGLDAVIFWDPVQYLSCLAGLVGLAGVVLLFIYVKDTEQLASVLFTLFLIAYLIALLIFSGAKYSWGSTIAAVIIGAVVFPIGVPVGMIYAFLVFVGCFLAPSLVYVLGLGKVVVVSPLLVPVAWAALLLQVIGPTAYRDDPDDIALSKSNLCCAVLLLAVALTQFGSQGVRFAAGQTGPLASEKVQEMRDTWPAETVTLWSSARQLNTECWTYVRDKAKQANATGIQLAGRRLPTEYDGMEPEQVMAGRPNIWAPVVDRLGASVLGWIRSGRRIAVVCGAFLLTILMMVYGGRIAAVVSRPAKPGKSERK
jgi:hypothetical protein